MAKWYAACVIYRRVGDLVEYLVINTRSLHPDFKDRSKVQTKFPGGTEQGHEEEDVTIEDTRDRELFEETHMRIREGFKPEEIHKEVLPNGHTKVFFLIPFDMLVGELRIEEKTVDNDWMSPPYWLNRFSLVHILYKSHQDALTEAIRKVK